MEQEPFIREQRRIIQEFSGMTPGETESHGAFEKLTNDTYEALLPPLQHFFAFRPEPEQSGFGLWQILNNNLDVNSDVIGRWHSWKDAYPALLARNPRLELKGMLEDISEKQSGSSWPYGFEWQIEQWVAGADMHAGRFSASVEFYDRLRVLHSLIGGWLYFDDEIEMVVFTDMKEFKQVRIRRDATKSEKIRETREQIEQAERKRLMHALNENGPDIEDIVRHRKLKHEKLTKEIIEKHPDGKFFVIRKISDLDAPLKNKPTT